MLPMMQGLFCIRRVNEIVLFMAPQPIPTLELSNNKSLLGI